MKFLEKFELFLFDLDGVVYIDDIPTPGSVEAINIILSLNKRVVFITNNPARSKLEYSNKLKKMGIDAKSRHILTSADSICRYLNTRIKNITGKSAYVIGSTYFKSQIKKTGITIDNGKDFNKTDFVIMGGHRKFNFNEINIATILIRKGAKFIATNHDPFYPTAHGLSPASGALVASIETASEKKALITGKPEKFLFEISMETAGFKNKKKTLLVGDNLYTDMLGGINFGIPTALTLTGLTTKKVLKQSKINPDYIIKDLSQLIK